MGDGFGSTFRTVWRQVDDTLRAIDAKLRSTFRWLRISQVGLILLLLLLAAASILPIFYPQYSEILYAVVLTVLLLVVLVPLIVIVSLPLRLKSVMRLIDKGYPANAKELAIRAMARKLHDESIETEELLFETAINEGRKMLRKYKERPDDDLTDEGRFRQD